MNKYFVITKPGLLLSNIMTVVVGYMLSTSGSVYWYDFLAVIFGLAFIMASSTTINNYIDQDIDTIMSRTKNRLSIINEITPRGLLVFSLSLFVIGFSILFLYTNYKVVLVAFTGYFVYVVLYTMWLKRRSTYSTIVGSISGGVPPLSGYLAHEGIFDINAILVFLLLATWQMTHFYAIGVYRLEDYTKANIKILPVVYGIKVTKYHMLFWAVAFLIVTVALGCFADLGITYYIISSILGLMWCKFVLDGFKNHVDNIKWGRKVFLFSIFHLMFLSVFIIVYCILFG